MSDSYTCCGCGKTEDLAGSAPSTPDHLFAKVHDGSGWVDLVGESPGCYVHAQFCSDACTRAWVDRHYDHGTEVVEVDGHTGQRIR